MAYFLYKHLKNKRANRATAPIEPVPDLPGSNKTNSKKPQALINQNQTHGEDSTNSKAPVVDAEEAERIKAETSRRRKYRWKMVAGLILPNFLASVDTTIVAPAVPIISS